MRRHAQLSSRRWLTLLGIGLAVALYAAQTWPGVQAQGTPTALALVNAASYDSTVAPGSLAALFSANMTAQAPQAASSVPLPTTLAGITVKVNGITAPLLFASAGQVNLQVPSGVAAGTATVEVFNGGASPVSAGTATVTEAAPGIFTFAGTEQAAALNSDYTINADFDVFAGSRPEASGNFVIIYATGVGNTNPLVADGQPAPSSPLAVATGTTTVAVDGGQGAVAAQVLYSGLAPGFVGLWQINLLLPASLPTNLKTSVRVDLKGRQSKSGPTIAVANRNEFGNVTGVVVSALTGNAIGGAGLSMPVGNKTRNVTTDGQGRYNFYIITPGSYTLTASAAGYLSATQGATIAGGQTATLAPIALTAPLATGQYRVVVTWQNLIDLDAHLTGPASSSRFHVWWNGETNLTTPATAQFDRDDLTGSGPETVTFTAPSGLYRFSVQDYTNRDTDGSTGIAQAGVIVRVFNGNQQVALFTAPSGGGTLWRVFEINNGTLTAINALTNEPDPSNIKVSF
jgi:uncharacterized protein (TIGR03437 family)